VYGITPASIGAIPKPQRHKINTWWIKSTNTHFFAGCEKKLCLPAKINAPQVHEDTNSVKALNVLEQI
jgi:hypothetical protein